jgi:hypothetical protein
MRDNRERLLDMLEAIERIEKHGIHICASTPGLAKDVDK